MKLSMLGKNREWGEDVPFFVFVLHHPTFV